MLVAIWGWFQAGTDRECQQLLHIIYIIGSRTYASVVVVVKSVRTTDVPRIGDLKGERARSLAAGDPLVRCAPFLSLAPSIQLDGNADGGRVLHDCCVVLFRTGSWWCDNGNMGSRRNIFVDHFQRLAF